MSGRHSKPSGVGMHCCVILEELDHCSLQVSPRATSSDTIITVKKDEKGKNGEEMSVAHTFKTIPVF